MRQGAEHRRWTILAWACLLACLASPAAASGATTVVSLQFDDGTVDQAASQAMLDARGMKATYFVNSGRIGKSGYLTRDQLLNLQADGMEIAGHTVDHLRLTDLSADDQRHQICDDLTALRAMGFDPTNFAYPFGSYDSTTESIVQSCGYKTARRVSGVYSGGSTCTSCPNAETLPPRDPYATLAPQSVQNTTTLSDIQGYVTRAEQHGGGLVQIFMHHVCDGCNQYSVSASTLSSFLDWLAQERNSGAVTVMTLKQAYGQTTTTPPPVVLPPPNPGPSTPPPTPDCTRKVTGTSGADTLNGRDGVNDLIHGLAGDDTLNGLSGDDCEYGDDGADKLFGHAGRDLLSGGVGNDYVNGMTDDDYESGDAGSDTIYGDLGDDSLSGNDGNDYLHGQDGNDHVSGGGGADQMYGGDGNDDLQGGDGNDVVHGQPGTDALSGDAGDDQLYGETGNDTLDGGVGNDQLFGQEGNDQVKGGSGDDRISGESGADILDGGLGSDSLVGGTGKDTLTGGSGNDFIDAVDGEADVVSCGDGTDRVISDTIDSVSRDCESNTHQSFVRVSLTCPGSSSTTCAGTITVQVASAARRLALRSPSVAYAITGGHRATVPVRASIKPGRRLIPILHHRRGSRHARTLHRSYVAHRTHGRAKPFRPPHPLGD